MVIKIEVSEIWIELEKCGSLTESLAEPKNNLHKS